MKKITQNIITTIIIFSISFSQLNLAFNITYCKMMSSIMPENCQVEIRECHSTQTSNFDIQLLYNDCCKSKLVEFSNYLVGLIKNVRFFEKSYSDFAYLNTFQFFINTPKSVVTTYNLENKFPTVVNSIIQSSVLLI